MTDVGVFLLSVCFGRISASKKQDQGNIILSFDGVKKIYIFANFYKIELIMEKFNVEPFNESKAINAVLYISKNLKRKDFHKIFKIFYFSDRDHISAYGRSITGDTYIAMTDGPVPSKLYDIFKSVRGDGYFKDEGKFSSKFTIENWDLIVPFEEPNMKVLSNTDLECINNALNLYGEMSWDEIREKSHDYAWRNTVLNSPISFDNMVIETGNDESYVDYLKEQIRTANSF